MSPTVEYVSQLLAASLLRAAWHGGIAVMAAWMIERIWTTMPGAWRSLLWRLVFLKLLLTLFIPVSIALPVLPKIGEDDMRATTTVIASSEEESLHRTEAASAAIVPAEKPRVVSASLILVALWLMGFVICLCIQRKQDHRALKRLHASRPIGEPYLQRLLESLSRAIGLKRPPQVRLAADRGSPCVVGGVRPAVVLPQAWFEACPEPRLRLAIAHELAHLARHDLAWNRLAAIGRAAFFFHPLVWCATRRYHLAQELACDELALQRTGGSPAEYASLLLQFVEQRAEPRWVGSLAMTGATVTLRERILAMNRSMMNGTSARGSAIIAAGLALLGFVPMSLAEPKDDREEARASASDEKQKSPSEKKQSTVKKKSASASASASGFASGGGFVDGGSSGGFSIGKAEAKVAVAIDDGEDVSPRDDEEDESPSSQKRKPEVKSSSSKSSVKQSMKSTDDGGGEKWNRTTEVSDGTREITIEESNDRIRVTIEADGNEKTYSAADASELKKKYPEAYELYAKYAGPKNSVKASASIGKLPASSKDNPAADILKKHREEFDRLKKKLQDDEGSLKVEGEHLDLLKKQLQEILESDDVRGTPLEDLLEDVKRKFDE